MNDNLIFDITARLNGLDITLDDHRLRYQTKLFSHSAVLFDSEETKIASMKRTARWHYRFRLTTSRDNYRLTRRWGTTELISKTADISFNDRSTSEFFASNNLRASECNQASYNLRNWQLEIFDKDHSDALLLANCFNIYLEAFTGG